MLSTSACWWEKFYSYCTSCRPLHNWSGGFFFFFNGLKCNGKFFLNLEFSWFIGNLWISLLNQELHPPFCVHSAGPEDRLPSASTCMNLLKLPEYLDDDTMREKLLYAVESGAGFELSWVGTAPFTRLNRENIKGSKEKLLPDLMNLAFKSSCRTK